MTYASPLWASLTFVNFTSKEETMQIVITPKLVARLTLINALMCPKTQTFGKTQKVDIYHILSFT